MLSQTITLTTGVDYTAFWIGLGICSVVSFFIGALAAAVKVASHSKKINIRHSIRSTPLEPPPPLPVAPPPTVWIDRIATQRLPLLSESHGRARDGILIGLTCFIALGSFWAVLWSDGYI